MIELYHTAENYDWAHLNSGVDRVEIEPAGKFVNVVVEVRKGSWRHSANWYEKTQW